MVVLVYLLGFYALLSPPFVKKRNDARKIQVFIRSMCLFHFILIAAHIPPSLPRFSLLSPSPNLPMPAVLEDMRHFLLRQLASRELKILYVSPIFQYM